MIQITLYLIMGTRYFLYSNVDAQWRKVSLVSPFRLEQGPVYLFSLEFARVFEPTQFKLSWFVIRHPQSMNVITSKESKSEIGEKESEHQLLFSVSWCPSPSYLETLVT